MTAINTYQEILSSIDEAGIKTKTKLIAERPDLYNALWIALKDVVHLALLSKTRRRRDGTIHTGNINKTNLLEESGTITRGDLESEIVVNMIDKLDLMLSKPLAARLPYTYTACNNAVDSYCRSTYGLPQHSSLTAVIDGTDGLTLQDLIGDRTYDGETQLLARERLAELYKIYSEQQRREAEKKRLEKEEKREDILLEMNALRERPAELLTRLALVYLGMKPRELSDGIMNVGVVSTYAKILLRVAKKYGITNDTIRSIIRGKIPESSDIKAETNDRREISHEVSRLLYRANTRIQRIKNSPTKQ